MRELNHSVVVVGASAGGLEAMLPIFARLPADTNAAVIVAQHSAEVGALPGIINRVAAMPARIIASGAIVAPRQIHVCPGGAQTTVEHGRFHVEEGRGAHRFTPSVDLLFGSVARCYRERAIAVVLSGMLNDGVLGAQILNQFGARMIVQEPQEAKHASMPRSVIREDHPDAILPSEEIGPRLLSLIRSETQPAI